MIGDRLKELREERNLNQIDIAEMLNTSRQSISAYENNITQPSIETLIKLADFYEVSTDYLLGRVRERENITTLVNKGLLLEIALLLKKYKITKRKD